LAERRRKDERAREDLDETRRLASMFLVERSSDTPSQYAVATVANAMAYHSRVTTFDEAVTYLMHLGTYDPRRPVGKALPNIIDDINVMLSARSD
jgi:hypothetical protein